MIPQVMKYIAIVVTVCAMLGIHKYYYTTEPGIVAIAVFAALSAFIADMFFDITKLRK